MSDNNSQTPFNVIKPWDNPVDGEILANDIVNLLNKYIYLPDGAAESIAMWILHTYDVNMFEFTPRLCILSPEKRCGKTTLLSLIEYLSNRVINVSSITSAVMFRSIEEWHPTLLVDEADTFLSAKDDLRGVINSGFRKGAKTSRIDGDKNRNIVFFDCYAPVAIAAIGRIPDTITDRGIILTMRRLTNSTTIQKMRTREIVPITRELQRKCLRFILDNANKIAALRPVMPDEFNCRQMDIWEPLYAIAEAISPEWADKIRTASIKLYKQVPNESESDGEKLLKDIQIIFNQEHAEWISSEKLAMALNEIEGSPWAEWNNRGLNVHSLARLLNPYKISSVQSRDGGRSRRYNKAQFVDAWKRYLPAIHVTDCATVPPVDELADLPY